MKHEKLINYFLKTIKTTEQLKDSLEVLEENHIDFFSLEKENFLLMSKFFFYIKKPNEEHRNFMDKIWNHNGGLYQKDLMHVASQSSYGRVLLTQNPKNLFSYFLAIFNNGSTSDVKSFLKKYPDFFTPEHIEQFNQNMLLGKKLFTKASLCQSAGMVFSYDNIVKLVRFTNPLSLPLYEFIDHAKPYLTAYQYDRCLISIMSACNITHYKAPDKSSICDAWAILPLFNDLKSVLAGSILKSKDILSPSGYFLDESNRSMELSEYIVKYKTYILQMNLDNFVLSIYFPDFIPHLNNDEIKNIIHHSKLLEKENNTLMFSNNWQLRNTLIYSSQFMNSFIEYAMEKCSTDTFIELAQVINNCRTTEKNPLVHYLAFKFPQNYTVEDLCELNKNSNLSEEFKTILLKAKLDYTMSPKDKHKSIKV